MMTVCLPPDWTAQCGDLWTHAVHDIFPKQAGEVTSGQPNLLIGPRPFRAASAYVLFRSYSAFANVVVNHASISSEDSSRSRLYSSSLAFRRLLSSAAVPSPSLILYEDQPVDPRVRRKQELFKRRESTLLCLFDETGANRNRSTPRLAKAVPVPKHRGRRRN